MAGYTLKGNDNFLKFLEIGRPESSNYLHPDQRMSDNEAAKSYQDPIPPRSIDDRIARLSKNFHKENIATNIESGGATAWIVTNGYVVEPWDTETVDKRIQKSQRRFFGFNARIIQQWHEARKRRRGRRSSPDWFDSAAHKDPESVGLCRDIRNALWVKWAIVRDYTRHTHSSVTIYFEHPSEWLEKERNMYWRVEKTCIRALWQRSNIFWCGYFLEQRPWELMPFQG